VIGQPARRVRRLALTARSNSLAAQGRTLIEDAMRTASLAGVEAGRLVIVRRLALGTLSATSSPATVALTLERRFAAIRGAVHIADPGAGTAEVIWCRDAAEADVALATRIARGPSPDEWFWRLAVPAWRADLPRVEGLRTVLFAALETPGGVLGALSLLSGLESSGVAATLLESLQPSDGPALIARSGWAAPGHPVVARRGPAVAAPPAISSEPRLPARWSHLVEDWVTTWGRHDARSAWLVATILTDEVPGRAADPHLPDRALRLLELRSTREDAPASTGDHRDSEPAVEFPQVERSSLHAPVENQSNRSEAAVPTAPTERPPQAGDEGPEGREPVYPPRAPSFSQDLGGSAAQKIADRQDVTGDRHVDEENAPMDEPWRSSDDPRQSRYAGLYFLLSVLVRLGLPEFLDRRDDLWDLDIGRRILAYIAARIGVPPDDAARLALGDIETSPSLDAVELPFVFSKFADVCVGDVWQLRRRPGADAWALCDGSGQLVVAQWRGRMPPDVRAVARRKSVSRSRRPVGGSDMEVLCRAWLTAMRRWCRREARMGLIELTRRPGGILASRMHLDVFLDLHLADVRIRRMGLDFDPGWLPWFGRVVLFHYLG
jgi:hypothetical protein